MEMVRQDQGEIDVLVIIVMSAALTVLRHTVHKSLVVLVAMQEMVDHTNQDRWVSLVQEDLVAVAEELNKVLLAVLVVTVKLVIDL